MKMFGEWSKLIKLLFSSNGQDVELKPPTSPEEKQTFQLPDLNTTDTHTLVTETLAQALTNKTLGSTNNISGATATSLTNSGTLTLPSGTDTIVSRNSSDTLTNKTIDGDDNTVQDLGLGVIKTSLADAYKLLQRTSTGTVDEAGTDAAIIPTGNDAGRPGSPVVGMTRYNSTSNELEIYTSQSKWEPMNVPAKNILHVAKAGARYTEVADAITTINAIGDKSASNPYVIMVGPGTFNGFTMSDYICVVGTDGPTATIFQGATTVISGTLAASDFLPTLTGCSVNLVSPASDGQYGINISGPLMGLFNVFTTVAITTDVAAVGVRLAPSVSCAMSLSSVQVISSTATTKNIIGVEMAGAGERFFNYSATRLVLNAASGTIECFRNSGTGDVSASGLEAVAAISNAAFAGTIKGICTTSVGAAGTSRLYKAPTIVLKGAGAGTAIGSCLDSGGSSDTFLTGAVMFISGFTANQEYVAQTAANDTQKVWLNSQNKVLGKSGSGLSIITPNDEQKSGFVEWKGNPSEGGATFWSWSAPNLTVSLTGTGVVQGAPVSWAAGQSVALTDLATNYVYMNSAGVIGVTSSGTESLFLNNIVLLECWRDGSNLLVTKENHPYKFTTAVSHAWHRLFGVLLEGTGAQIAQFGVAGNRQIEVQGADVLTDHGLDTTVPASGGAITMNFVYTGTAGAAKFFSSANVFPDAVDTGTSTTTVGSNKWVVHRVGVTKSNLNSASPQYISVIPTTEYNSLAAAQAAISAGSIQAFPSEIKALETAQLGYVILYKNAGGSSFSIVSVIVEKQTFTARFLGSTPATQAALITVDATAYSDADAVLGSTDVTAQAAFDQIYAVAVKQSATLDTAEADGVPRYTSTDGRSIGVATTPMKQSATGVVTIQNTTASSSKDTGALIVEGGVGVEEDLYAGGQVVAPTVNGTTTVTSPLLTVSAGGTAAAGKISYNSNKLELGANATVADAGDIVSNATVSGTTLNVSTSITLEETGAGTDKITIQAPASIAAPYSLTLPIDDGDANQILTTDGSGVLSWTTAGAGDIQGPASSVDEAIARFNGTTGKLLQDYSSTAPTISDAGIVNVNNTTDATSGTDGSLQTDGGLSVAKAAYIGTTATAVTSVVTPLIKAIDGNGIKFQENGGTQVMSISDAGAVTAGPTSGTTNVAHTLQSYDNAYVILKNIRADASAKYNWKIATNSSVADALEFIPSTAAGGSTFSTTVGYATTAGAWTLGPASGLTAKHIIRASGPTSNVVLEVKNSSADECIISISGSTNNVGIGSSAGQAYISGITSKTASGGAAVYVTGTSLLGTSTSVREAKTNIQPLSSTIGWLKQLKPYVYQYRKQVDGKYTDEAEDFVNTGLIYDEVVQVNPQLCFDTADGKPSGVEYTRLITPLLKAFQEQQALIETLQAKVAALEAR